jgi:hypothetical protein
MTNPKTVKIILIDDEPRGVKKVKLSNWSGTAFVVPRNKLNTINKRNEFEKPCVYFLVGGLSTSPEIYVGETYSFGERISEYHEKDFWNTCIVFFSEDYNLTKAKINFLEAKFIEDCKKAHTKMYNCNSKKAPRLLEEHESEMIQFRHNMKLVLSALGFTFHEVDEVEKKDTPID